MEADECKSRIVARSVGVDGPVTVGGNVVVQGDLKVVSGTVVADGEALCAGAGASAAPRMMLNGIVQNIGETGAQFAMWGRHIGLVRDTPLSAFVTPVPVRIVGLSAAYTHNGPDVVAGDVPSLGFETGADDADYVFAVGTVDPSVPFVPGPLSNRFTPVTPAPIEVRFTSADNQGWPSKVTAGTSDVIPAGAQIAVHAYPEPDGMTPGAAPRSTFGNAVVTLWMEPVDPATLL